MVFHGFPIHFLDPPKMSSTFPLQVEQWEYDLREKQREELELLLGFLNPKEVASEEPWLILADFLVTFEHDVYFSIQLGIIRW